MYFFVPSLFTIVYFLPVNGVNYMKLLKYTEDADQNVADTNPKTSKNPIPNVRKSLGNNIPGLKLSENDLNKILRGYKLEDYLSRDEIHEIKVKQLTDFIQTHYLSAEYFYDEMQRIVKQHEIKDDLRNMVTYFEKNPHLKPKILDAFNKIKVANKSKPDIWSLKTNNLAASLDASWYN